MGPNEWYAVVVLLLMVVTGCQVRQEATVTTVATPRSAREVLFAVKGSQDFETCVAVLQSTDVDSDIAHASGVGDRRLIAIRSLGVYVPGVPEFIQGRLPVGYTAVPISGTSDYIKTPVQHRCQDLLHRYAERYNRGILGAQQSAAER
jgi:hypothetical protein